MRAISLVVLLASVAASVGCSDGCSRSSGAGGERGEGGELGASASSGGAVGARTDPATAASERRAAEAELAGILALDGDAGPSPEADASAPLDRACGGTSVDLAAILAHPRCAIASSLARHLRAQLEPDASTTPLPLRQEARVVPDGSLAFRVINTGKATLVLPLSYHARLPAFTALAEDASHAVYELAPPRLEITAGTGRGAPRFARVSLAPGAAATARVTLVPEVVRRVIPPCRVPDVGATSEGGERDRAEAPCAPPRLGPGRYVVHVGQLVTDVEAGAPARVEWEIPAP